MCPTVEEVGSLDLRRSLLQGSTVLIYLTLMCTFRPYVASRTRRWKLYVTFFNKMTILVVICSRLVAEQARAQRGREEGGEVVGSSSTDLFWASLVLLELSCVMCMLQFVVLFIMFMWSLFEGAKEEQREVVRIEKVRAAEIEMAQTTGTDAPEKEGGGRLKSVASETVNPMRTPKGLLKSTVGQKSANFDNFDDLEDLESSGKVGPASDHLDYFKAPMSTVTPRHKVVPVEDEEEEGEGVGEEEDPWSMNYDEESGHWYHHNAVTGETVWVVEEGGGEGEGGEEHVEEEHAEDEGVDAGWEGEGGGDEEDWGGEEDTCAMPEDICDGTPASPSDEVSDVRARLRSVMLEGGEGQGGGGEDGEGWKRWESLMVSTRGDWAEVLDDDGSLLGEAYKGVLVYFHKVTFETRLTKPPGWVRMQAAATDDFMQLSVSDHHSRGGGVGSSSSRGGGFARGGSGGNKLWGVGEEGVGE
jgi:uncharacterized membrane protein YgcG